MDRLARVDEWQAVNPGTYIRGIHSSQSRNNPVTEVVLGPFTTCSDVSRSDP